MSHAETSPADRSFPLDEVLVSRSSAISRDLSLNLRRLLEDGALDAHEAALTLLATATSAGHSALAGVAREKLAALGVASDEIQEAAESAAIMGMLNMYYRFRHMVGKNEGAEANYATAGLRMTSLAKPAMGKHRFEMLALAVSVLNGCETCISSHEKVLRDAGIEPNKIHDLAKLAAVVKGLTALHSI